MLLHNYIGLSKPQTVMAIQNHVYISP